MGYRSGAGRVMPVRNLQDYFRTSIDEVIAGQGVDLDPHATHYVVNMMTLFARSEELYEDDGEHFGLRPLALMLADAADAPSQEHRNQTLQRIGDVALFISGFFIESLINKAVDVDYYIHMGENAYGSLSEEVRGTFRGNAFADIFRNNAEKNGLLPIELSEAEVDQIFDVLVRDFSKFALQLYSKTSSTARQRLLCRRMIRKPVVDPERFERVWENHVFALRDTYRMSP